MRTQVGIVGAGPAGLMLSHLLHLEGIQSVILERHSREYVEARIRAGVIEHWAADLLVATGVGERMQREGLVHGGIYFSFNDKLRRVDFEALVGKGILVYGQHEVVKDLIARRLADGGQILFDVGNVSVEGLTGAPKIRFEHAGAAHELDCDFIGGCDGFHGVCRPSVPDGVLTAFEREYPFGWLGILAQARPVSEELIYCLHQRGFALFSMRAPELVRLYIQCAPDEDIAQWPDQKVWQELHARLAITKSAELAEGPVVEKVVAAMRSFVVEPMQYGRLFLAGESSAHIVPPTGAKGMNLALADVLMLSRGIEAFYRGSGSERLEAYSATCLRRVWKAQRFSWWMTQMLHTDPQHGAFDRKRQLAELDYVTSSEAAARSLAENYVGLPLED